MHRILIIILCLFVATGLTLSVPTVAEACPYAKNQTCDKCPHKGDCKCKKQSCDKCPHKGDCKCKKQGCDKCPHKGDCKCKKHCDGKCPHHK